MPKSSMEEMAAEWLNRVDSALVKNPASEVYGGRGFQEALAASEIGKSDLRIISAGLGLVKSSQTIPAYGLTTVRGVADDISRRVVGEFVAPQWWKLINGGKTPLRSLISRSSHVVAMGLSRSYVPLICEDLLGLSDEARQRLRIVGLSIADALPNELRPFVLPYDDRLDGPDSVWRGTRGDFSARALRHFAAKVWTQSPDGDLISHKKTVERLLRHWRPAPRFSRHALTDAEVIKFIKRSVKETQGQSSKALRHLRDSGYACEQSRFKDLFKQAVGK